MTTPKTAVTEVTGKAAKRPKPVGVTRLRLDLSPRAMAQLTEVKEKADASSYAEIIKNALKLYDGIIAEMERGSAFLIRDKDGKVSEFRMFL